MFLVTQGLFIVLVPKSCLSRSPQIRSWLSRRPLISSCVSGSPRVSAKYLKCAVPLSQVNTVSVKCENIPQYGLQENRFVHSNELFASYSDLTDYCISDLSQTWRQIYILPESI